MKRFLVLLTAILTFVASHVVGGVPTAINYQGLLTDGSGVPVADGTYEVIFTIYDAAAAGNSQWTEGQNVVTSKGLFAVLLGSINPIEDTVFSAPTRYLGIKVGTDPELSPRTMMVTVPYSMRVSTVDGATGGNITSKVSIGTGHTNSGEYSFVAGNGNDASGWAATISGGKSNKASSDEATVGGGHGNIASGFIATVGGGYANRATYYYATIGGGMGNIASDEYCTVGGGANNYATSMSATVSGGDINLASGKWAAVPGGLLNTAAGDFSFAAGLKAKANHKGTFVWADSTNADFASTGGNQFLIRASGGVGIGTNSPWAGLHIKGAGFPKSFGYFDTDTIGQDAGLRFYEDGTPKSHIFHAAGTNTLNLYGDDYSGIAITSTGSVGIGTIAPNYKLDVRGSIGSNSTLYHSDLRWKKNIATLSNSIGMVQKLRGVSYDWKDSEYADMNFPKGKQIGLIAQEVERVLPEVVHTGADGYKSVDYSKLVALLIEANKEQQMQIDELRVLVNQLASQTNKSEAAYGLK